MRLFTGTARASHHPWQQPEEANGRALLAAGVGLRRYPMIIVVPRCTSPSKTQSPPSSLAGMLTTRGPIRFEADPERAACAHLKGDGGASRPLRSERTLPHAAVACQHCSGDLVCTSQKRHAVFFSTASAMDTVNFLFWPAEQFGHGLPSPIGAANGVAEKQVRSRSTIVPEISQRWFLTSIAGKG